jgi:hypothetical protein
MLVYTPVLITFTCLFAGNSLKMQHDQDNPREHRYIGGTSSTPLFASPNLDLPHFKCSKSPPLATPMFKGLDTHVHLVHAQVSAPPPPPLGGLPSLGLPPYTHELRHYLMGSFVP